MRFLACLEKAGILAAFHTDANAVKGLGKWLSEFPFGSTWAVLKTLRNET